MTNLKKDFAEFELPVGYQGARRKNIEVKIMNNLFLELQTEANSGSAERPLGHSFCNLIKKPESFIAEGVQQLLDEVNGDFPPEPTTGTKKAPNKTLDLVQLKNEAQAQGQARILEENPALDEAQARAIVQAQAEALDKAQELIQVLGEAKTRAQHQSQSLTQAHIQALSRLSALLAKSADQNLTQAEGNYSVELYSPLTAVGCELMSSDSIGLEALAIANTEPEHRTVSAEAQYPSLAQLRAQAQGLLKAEAEARELVQGLDQVMDEAEALGLTLNRSIAEYLPVALAQIQAQAQAQAQALAQILDEGPALDAVEKLAQVIGQAKAMAESLAQSPVLVGDSS
ncbi:hypothetical protein [Endozoicomonas sp. ONNA2]|uniref:hypothetical protein n=1 Tax=Endozoicomonas sp. ONNA2 TaxID=2828741 RepID=UPI002148D836|nr:hypothetical protein [Endozoicomonas sp. ONNA2]